MFACGHQISRYFRTSQSGREWLGRQFGLETRSSERDLGKRGRDRRQRVTELPANVCKRNANLHKAEPFFQFPESGQTGVNAGVPGIKLGI